VEFSSSLTTKSIRDPNTWTLGQALFRNVWYTDGQEKEHREAGGFNYRVIVTHVDAPLHGETPD